MMKLLLIGDSDIAFWPKGQLPIVDGIASKNDVFLSGHSGATLEEVVAKVRQMGIVIQNATTALPECAKEDLVVVACAGENDIGNGIPLDSSVTALEAFISEIFAIEENIMLQISSLIFLGPKFEPWLDGDSKSKKQYAKMSRSFARCCKRNSRSDRIYYVDCLTMFCGDSAILPGAVLGGRACADPQYFASDRLHLNEKGYALWESTVVKHIQSMDI